MAQAQSTAAALNAYGDPFTQVERAPKTQARVYAFRSAQANSLQPVNLYINGRYHASLLQGGYTEFCTPAGKWQLQTALNDAEQQHKGKQQAGLPVTAEAGQVLYLQVKDSGPATAQAVAAPQALEVLRATRRQQHTVSRAPQVVECDTDLTDANPSPLPATPAAVAKKLPPQRQYALETDALFEFGKTELRAAGFNAIESLIEQVHKDYSTIDRIRVLGYSDAIGPAKLNRKLSLERAKAVAERLSDRGLKAKRPIQTEGRGDEELIRTDCHNSPTPANKACHAPNRRVVIVVYGVRR